MPSHIFLQLGMWPEAAASNEAAWESSDAWMKRKNLSVNVRDYHSLHWLMYAYLQQGRYQKAEELLTLMKKVMSESTYDNKLRPGYYENNWANMAASFIVETERWNLADELFPQNKPTSEQSAGTNGSHGGMHAGSGGATVRTSTASQNLPIFIRGLQAAVAGKASELQSIGPVNKLEVEALKASMNGDNAGAIDLMKKATAAEEQGGAPYGPPGLIKPSHELFGEILLRAGKPKEAVEAFKVALLRQPNRARSLLGLARASAKSGDTATARSTYTQFLEQWKQADSNLQELAEARDYLKQH
jgi:tetratricopeptide (TPR) repeat protein